MGFKQKGNLQRHIKVHTGDTCKPYKCDVCDIMFTQRKDQQRHMRMHTGDKPYKCDVNVLLQLCTLYKRFIT
jgi:uncharacterized Zn-finger protein